MRTTAASTTSGGRGTHHPCLSSSPGRGLYPIRFPARAPHLRRRQGRVLQPCACLVRLELHPVPVQPEVKVLFLSGGRVSGRPPLPVVAPDGNREVLGVREGLQAEGGHRRRAERRPLPARQAGVADDLEGGLVDRRVEDVLGAVYLEWGVSNAEVSHSEIRVVHDDLQ